MPWRPLRNCCTESRSSQENAAANLAFAACVITVYDVLGWLAAGMSRQEILDDYPELEPADIQACLAFAAGREQRMVRIVA